LDAFENQDYQFDHLLEHLEIKRDAARNPLFDTIFSLQNLENEDVELEGVMFKPYELEQRAVQFDLGLQMHEKDSKVFGALGYSVKLYKKETMLKFIADFISITEQIIGDDQLTISAVKVEYETEETRLLHEFNQTGGNAKEVSAHLEIEIEAAIYEKVYPMTTLQRDFYLDSQRNPLSCGHRVSSYRLYHRALNAAKWEEAVKLVIKKYPLLRSGYLVEGDRFFQGVRKYTGHESDFLYQEREAITGRGREAAAGSRNGSENLLDIQQELYEEIKKITQIPHDVTLKPVKFFLIKFAPDLFASALSVHHTFFDGASSMVVYEKVEENYDKLSKGETPTVQADHTYEKYVAFHHEHFDTGKVKRYWEKKLSAVEPVRSNQRARQASKYINRRIPLGLEGSKEIVAFCKRAGVSPAVYFKGLYGMMLHYYTRPTADYHIRDVASGRPPRYQAVVGPMILVIPTIVDVTRFKRSNNITIAEYLQEFRRQKKELGDNQYISNNLQTRLIGRQELYFDYNFLAFNAFDISAVKGIPLEIVEEEENAVVFRIEQTTNGFTICFHYNEKEFFGERFIERIEHISRQLLTGTEYLSDLTYHFEDEKDLLWQWNDTAVTYPAKTVVEAFEEQANQTPDATALVGNAGKEHTLTYSQFNRQADHLAHRLRQKGVGPETVVALVMEPGIQQLIGLWGILKAGGAYLPIEPGQPAHRLAYILQDANTRMVAAGEQTQQEIEALPHWEGEIIPVHRETANTLNAKNTSDSLNTENTPKTCNTTDLAYIIYTSGSTGRPKGVAVEHRNLYDYVETFNAEFRISPKDRVLRLISFAFDASVEEIYPVLCRGGALI
ncbi:MAG: AMP-binding protein, partial [bacterium]|nr:AMP-binding protein [bacterium]